MQPFGPSTRPLRVACAVLLAIWATCEIISRGLRDTSGHLGQCQCQSAWPAQYLRPCWPSAKPICVARAALAAISAIGKAIPRGLRSTCGRLGHRQGQSARPAQYWRPCGPLPRLFRAACAILADMWAIGEAILRGLRKACDHFESSGRPIRAACAPLAAVWAIGKANLRGRRSACGHLGHRQSHSAWPAQHLRPYGPEAGD